MDHCDMHPSFRRFREGFVVLTQPTTPSDPRQCSLNYPSSWQHGKLMTATRTPHNLQGIARRGLNPIYQLPGVSCVSPNQSQAGKPSFQLVHNQPCPVPVLDVSRVNHDSQQHPYGIHDDVTLASHHLLTSVKSHEAPFFRRLDRLAVYDSCTGSPLPPFSLGGLQDEGPHGLAPRCPRSSTCGSIGTLSATAESHVGASAMDNLSVNIEDAVDHLPYINRTWPSA